MTVPSGPKSFSSLSWAADHSFFSLQIGKTHCLILEYANAYTFIFSENLPAELLRFFLGAVLLKQFHAFPISP